MASNGPVSDSLREDFENWYLSVVKGDPANLAKDQNGCYTHVGSMYLGWEAATLIEREKCKRDCRQVEQAHLGVMQPYHGVARECVAAIEKRAGEWPASTKSTAAKEVGMPKHLQAVLSALPQQQQRQDSTNAQLRDLRVFSNRLGMYDAADVLRILLERG